MASNPIFGVGINDAGYQISKSVTKDGSTKIVWMCPFYKTWKSMIVRCYSKKYQESRPTYYGCSVCDEWLSFSNFRQWMVQQDWQDKVLDKDLLVKGNKIYSPDTCVFVDNTVNAFINENGKLRGAYMIGVSWNPQCKKFAACCNDPFSKKCEKLGLYQSELDAHLAWKSKKLEIAIKLGSQISDKRISDALRSRYE